MASVNSVLQPIIQALIGLIPMIGSQAHRTAERALTIPEGDIRRMMGGASDEQKDRAVALGRLMADAAADFAVYVASRGEIEPD